MDRPSTEENESTDVAAPLRDLIKPEKPSLYIPVSGLLILGLDWLFFSSNALSGGLATPLIVVLGFITGTAGTFILQRWFAEDPWWKAAIKALIAGVVVGAPWPIGGTILGGWVLLSSGLRMGKK